MQGRLLGRMEALGFELRDEATLSTLTMDVLKSSEIEGEFLHPEQVRSSVARRLGMDVAGLVYPDRNIDGVVEMVLARSIVSYRQKRDACYKSRKVAYRCNRTVARCFGCDGKRTGAFSSAGSEGLKSRNETVC